MIKVLAVEELDLLHLHTRPTAASASSLSSDFTVSL